MKKLMKYYVISGRTVEEVASKLSSKADRQKKRGIRRAGTSSEAKIKANERSSVRRLARGIACNFEAGDAFVTLKYDAEHYPGSMNPAENVPGSEGYIKAQGDLTRFLRKLRAAYRKKTGKALKGYWETANWSPKRKAPARLHQHLVVPSDAVEIIRSIWTAFGGAGTVIIRDLDGDPDRTRIADYMVHNVSGTRPGEKGWSGSRGMDQPLLSEPEEISDIDELQPPAGAIIKAADEVTDEDGIVVGKYIRYVLPEAPQLKGGRIVLPKKTRRRAAADAS